MAIWVCGVPRAGKTTFCKKLKKENPNFTIIVSEAIRNAFQKMDKSHYKEWGIKTSKQRQNDFPIFFKEFVEWNEKFSGCETIVDCALIDLEKVFEIADKKDKIICFGFGGKSVEEILKIIRKREKEEDYTKNYSDLQLLKFWGDISIQDKKNLEFSKLKSIKYVDNSNI